MPPSAPTPTARLAFRPWHDDDAEALLDTYGRPEVYRFLGASPSPVVDVDDARQRIARWSTRIRDGLGVWAIVRREVPEARPVGTALLVELPRSDGAASDAVEIGWHLHPEWWGLGYATEAGAALVAAATARGQGTVRAVLYPENHGSAAVCERLGMTMVGLTGEWYGVELVEYRLDLARLSR